MNQKDYAMHKIAFDSESELQSCLASLRRLELISCPGIVGIKSIDRKDRSLIISTPRLSGMKLNQFIGGGRSLSDEEIARLGTKLCEDLAYLHGCSLGDTGGEFCREKIIYQNLSPDYVFISENGEVLLKNPGECFGYRMGQRTYDISSRKYTAPEILHGRVADERSDIYGLGITLLYCLKDRQPGIHLSVVLDRCINENPDLRYQNVSELRDALAQVLKTIKATELGKFMAQVAVAVTVVSLFLFFLLSSLGFIRFESKAKNDFVSNESITENSDIITFSEDITKGDTTMEMAEYQDDEYYDTSVTDAMSEYEISIFKELLSKQKEAESLMAAGVDDEKNLKKALRLLIKERELLADLDADGILMDYTMQNLSMLSTIYRLLGRKCPGEKESYYEKSLSCIEDLFDLDGIKQTELYRLKISDIVLMKNEIGDKEGAIEYLREWEKNHPDEGIELYISHISLLLESDGNKKEVEELYEKIQKISESEGDFKLQDISKRVREYLKKR